MIKIIGQKAESDIKGSLAKRRKRSLGIAPGGPGGANSFKNGEGVMAMKRSSGSRDLTGLEVLGVAIRSEIDAHRFYSQALRITQNPLLREKLSRLAAEEKRHRQILEERYRKSTGEKFPLLPRKGGAEGKGKAPKDLEPEELLKIAIRREQEAAQFYRREAQKSTDMSGRFMLEYLADFEMGHERSLRSELKALRRFPQWFSLKDPVVMLVGP